MLWAVLLCKIKFGEGQAHSKQAKELHAGEINFNCCDFQNEEIVIHHLALIAVITP